MRTCSEMPYHCGMELRMYPSYRQKKHVAVNDGAERFVYNRLVALNEERRRLRKTAGYVPAERDRLGYLESILHGDNALPAAIKNSAPFLYDNDIDSLVVDNAIKNYRVAWKKYREDHHAGRPRFHKKGYRQSYNTNAHYRKDAKGINDANARFEDEHHMVLPGLGRIRIAGSAKRIRAIMCREDTRIGTITIRRDAIGRYFVSLQLASEKPFVEPFPASKKAVGIDLNIDNFLFDSDGNEIKNPKYRRNLQGKLAKVQKRMSRKAVQAKKDGKPLRDAGNYQRDRLKAAKLQDSIARRGDEFRNIVSKRYAESQGCIFAEDLKVRNLLKNHKLALAISECGWSDFLRKLEYKADMYGRVFVKVPPHYTTQTCSVCGHVMSGDERLPLSARDWVCPSCGTYHIRDYNAAANILARGMASLA